MKKLSPALNDDRLHLKIISFLLYGHFVMTSESIPVVKSIQTRAMVLLLLYIL